MYGGFGDPGGHSADILNSSLHPKAAKQRHALLKLVVVRVQGKVHFTVPTANTQELWRVGSLSAGDTARSIESHVNPLHPTLQSWHSKV